MLHYSFEHDGTNYARVDKRVARRAFERGDEIAICPCNLRPGGPWHPEMFFSNVSWGNFDSLVNAFERYNCANSETGLYASYFVRL